MRPRRVLALALATLAGAGGALVPPFATPASAKVSRGGGAGRVVHVGGCSLVSTTSTLGGACAPSGKDGVLVTPGDLLKGDPVPLRWDERMTPADRADMGLPVQPGCTWYWTFELKGIDPETKKITGEITLVRGHFCYSDNPSEPPRPKGLTAHQRAFVDHYAGREQIPDPILATSPSRVHVNQSVSFYDVGRTTVEVGVGGMQLRARLVAMSVVVEGVEIACDGGGVKTEPGVDPAEVAGACVGRFTHSSADLPDREYVVPITTTWVAEYRSGGGWVVFNTFSKTADNTLRVDEIESLVIR